MASEARPRSPLEGARRRRERENNRSGYVTLGAVRYSVRRAGVPARAGAGTCPCRCCSEELVAACLPRAKPERRTLERLRGRLGRGRDERPSRHQRLQALTERLMPRAPAPPPSPPPHSAPVLPPVPPPRSRHRHSPPRGVSVDRCDDFDADNITLVRVEPRSIVGSYAQKTIPYRSASFSQGDFAQDKYYRVRQPSIFDFGKRTNKTEAGRAGSVPIRRDGESSHDENATEGGSVASVDSAVGSDEGLLAHASPAPRSQPPGAPDALHKLGGRSLTHPLPRRAPPLRAGAAEGGSLPALGRVLQELREESDGSQADSAQPHSEGASPLEPTQPFAFPPLPAPPNACANLNCECSSFPTESEELAISIESSIPVPVYECIVKQWSQELLPQEDPTRDNVSDGSLDRDKEDETITSEQVANLLAAVQSTGSAPVPLSPTPVLATAGVRERRRPSDKSKRRKGIYITTASDDGGEEEPPAVNGCQRESSDASLQEMRLSAEARTSSLLGDKSDDSCTNGPPSPCEVQTLMWPRSEELRARRARFSQQSSDERDDESYRTRRKYGVTSRGDSPSEAESDTYSRDRTASPSPFSPSDTSDVEAKRQQFSRSNFGRTLEAPAIKSAEVGRRSLSDATVPNRKSSAGTPSAPGGEGARARGPTHVRATSSPSKLAGARGAGADLLQELLRGSSEALSNAAHFDNVVLTLGEHNDTRTHVVVELYETEKSYVDSLDILVKKYLQPLKSPENAGLLEASVVDEIFFQVPAILAVHRAFLEQLRRRLETWDLTQKVGDVFLEVFTKPAVMETYMSFINNLKRAKSTAKAAAAARPAFARFLDARARDHKGKLSLDNLLIKPVQKFPSYKLLVERLIKNTEPSHPDHKYLVEAKKEVLQLLELINCTERESLELEQQLQTLRDLEQLIEGLSGLARPERALLRLEAVQMAGAGGGARERALFLLSDTLLVTSVKRRTTTIKKPIPTYQSSIASQMEGNKYKLLMRIPLADLEIVKAKDENVRRMMCEVEALSADVGTLRRVTEQLRALHAPLPALEDAARDALHAAARSLADRQAADAQLCQLELSVSTQNGPENLTIIFPKTEKRTSWEELLNETKQKLSSAGGAARAAQFVSPVPVRKTRAGLQFTCAAPTRPAPGQPPDVWVCNSDGYVGQVCVLSLQPRPQVASCTGVCNARILCVASVPAPAHTAPSTSSLNSVGSAKPGISVSDPDDSCQNIRLDSSSSSDEDDDASSTSEPPEPATPAPAPAPPAPALAPAPAPPAPNHSKSLSSPHTGPAAHAAAHPVMKSNSNPAVDKQAMGITSGTLSSPASRQSSEDGGAASGAASGAAGGAAGGAGAQATMWLGTEDGCVHVYNCQDNIRVKKNKIKLQHSAAVHAIVYLEEKVFVALGNGDLVVYGRDLDGSWSERARVGVGVGGAAGGAGGGALLPCGGRLWCAAASCIKIVSPHTLQVEETFQISSESKPISHMAVGGGALWLALRHAPLLRCFALARRELRADVNITAAVARMLRGCDDIIRQHKAACLRVTALLALRGALWVGTSAGVLLTAALPAPGAAPQLVGVTYGHTGHVRFLTVVENPVPQREPPKTQTLKTKALHRRSGADKPPEPAPGVETLVISGGDGYEDFRSAASSEDAGREDSTNHLLLWRV